MDRDGSLSDSHICVPWIPSLVLQEHVLWKVLIMSKHNEFIKHNMGHSWEPGLSEMQWERRTIGNVEGKKLHSFQVLMQCLNLVFQCSREE